MKKTTLLLGMFSLSVLYSQAQMSPTRKGFRDDFNTVEQHADVNWGSVTAGTYTINRTTSGMEVTLSHQNSDGYQDMEVSFGTETDGTTLKTIDLSSNSDYFVAVENMSTFETVLVLSMYCRDVNNRCIAYNNEFGTWTTKIGLLLGKDEKDTIKAGQSGVEGSDEEFSLSGHFKDGMDLYPYPNGVSTPSEAGVPNLVDFTKITHIRFRLNNGTEPLDNAKIKFKTIRIGDQTGVGINETSKNQIGLYPNPVTNGNISFDAEIENINIYNSLGALVKSEAKATSVNVSELTSGMYFLQSSKGQAKFLVK